jgi:AcrR family transcriptional regulator
MSTEKNDVNPGPKRVRRDRKEEILHAAVNAFAEKGYRGATTLAIANSIGLTEAGLFHYFPGKAHLLKGVLAYRDEQYLERVKLVSPSQKKELPTMLGNLEGIVAENEEFPVFIQLFTVLVAESISNDHPAHDYFVNRFQLARQLYKQAFSELTDVNIPSEASLNELATVTIAVLDGLQIQYLLDPDEVDMLAAFRLFSSLLRSYLQKK